MIKTYQLLAGSGLVKKEEIYELITQITQEAIQLKRKYRLENEPSPTDFLNTVAPDWKASFPIQVSPATANFLDQLLTEVAKLSEPRKYEISLKRELVKIGLEWVVNATVKFPDGFYDYEDLHLAKQEQALIHPVSSVEVALASTDDIGTKKIYTAFRTLKNDNEGFSIRGIDEYQLGKNAGLHSWILRCVNYEHDVDIELPLPGGEALDNELPWAFVEKDGRKLFKGAGSVSIKATTIYVVADRLWAKDGSYQMVGSLNGDKDVYQVTGECSITAGGQTFLYRTNTESDTGYFYTLQGKKLNYQSQQGDELYLGLPTVYKVDSDNLNKAPVRKQIYVRKRGENQRYGECKNEMGILRVQVLGEHSEVLFSKKVNVLPVDFSIGIESISPVEGRVKLENSSPFAISLKGNASVGEIEKRESSHLIRIKSSQEIPPKYVAVSLRDEEELTLKVPFPSQGAKFFDKNEDALVEGQKLYLNDLFGYSLLLFNAATTRKNYTMIFSLSDKEGSPLRIFRKIKVEQFQREVPLLRYKNDFLKLFSVTEALDATVKVRVEHGPSVIVKGYSTSLRLQPDEGVVTLIGNFQSLSHAEIKAFRFDESLENQEVHTLHLVSIDENQGKWSLAEEDRKPGKWLLFPAAKSAIQFRPRLWIIGQETEDQPPVGEIAHIREAASISNTSQRIDALTNLVQRMSQNLENTNWPEVGHLWKLTKHLPLSTFDLWTAFTRNDEALVSLLFFQENELIDRLSNEYPILWETIPVKVWIDGAMSRYEHFNKLLPDYADNLVTDKFQYIESQLRLTCVAAILRNEILGLEASDLSGVGNPDIVKFQFNLLLNGGTEFPGLKNRKAEEGWQWPEYLNQDIRSTTGKLPKELKSLFPSELTSHRVSVIFLPVALAASTVVKELHSWNEKSYKQIFQIREIQSFDEEWFRAIYDLIQGHCWINYKLTEI